MFLLVRMPVNQKKAAERDAALRKKACESKNRYSCKSDAEAAIIACAEYGTTVCIVIAANIVGDGI